VEDRERARSCRRVVCPPFDEALLSIYLDSYLRPRPPPRPTPREPAAARAQSLPRALRQRYSRDDERDRAPVRPRKQKQWDAALTHRLEHRLDPENPEDLPDDGLPSTARRCSTG
jgi:hypothetical protein